jgi:dynamin-like GTPase MGM1, mitochondrial
VENCIKPYKFEIDVEEGEWARGRENISTVLKKELKACEAAVKSVEETVGGRKKLRDIIAFVDRARKGEIAVDGDGVGGAGGYSAALLQKGKTACIIRAECLSLT